jgi:ribonuclease P protein component
VRAAGRRVGNALFGVHYLPNDCGHARLGMAVGLRVAGTAVRRNRIRRCVRESFRLHQHLLPPVDLFVSARSAARDATGPEMFASLERLWRQLGEP